MKLRFERWLDSSSFDEGILALFRESALAYKAGCYRAALIMGYLGLLAEVRSRVLKASAPSGFESAEWEKCQEEMQDDESWDKQLVRLLLQEPVKDGKPVPFTLSKDERNAINYFKMLRNVSAHGKDEEIGASHVESLWAFICRDLPRLVVNGSFQWSIRATLNHFDLDLSPPGRSFDELAGSLNVALRPNEVPDYLDALLKEQPVTDLFGTSVPDWEHSWICDVLASLSLRLDSDHESTLKEWLQREEHFDVLRATLLRLPECDMASGLDEMVVRRLWHREGTLTSRDVQLYISLRRKQLVPDDETGESVMFLVSHMGYYEALSSNDESDLDKWGFWTYVKEYLIASVVGKNMDFKTANPRSWLLERYLERCGVDVGMAAAIYRMAISNRPFDVERAIIGYLRSHSECWQLVKSQGELPSDFVGAVEDEQ